MNHGEILALNIRNGNAGDAFGGWRKCREECEGQMPHRIAKLWAVGAVPGIDRIEARQIWDASAFDHADQIESGVDDGACAVGESNQRKHRTRHPDFGVIGAGSFESGQGQNNVPDGSGPDEESSG